MAKSYLYAIEKDANFLRSKLHDDDNLPAWVNAKIATAADRVQQSRRYMQYKVHRIRNTLPPGTTTAMSPMLGAFSGMAAAGPHGPEALGAGPSYNENGILTMNVDQVSALGGVASMSGRAGTSALRNAGIYPPYSGVASMSGRSRATALRNISHARMNQSENGEGEKTILGMDTKTACTVGLVAVLGYCLYTKKIRL
jgi:hypothetical protein